MSTEPPASRGTTDSNDSGSQSPGDDSTSKEEGNARLECNICLDIPRDAVVSLCGHLFCWPCLHKWLETRPNRQNCPVCKSGLDQSKVVPIYGRGSGNTDPRSKVPPRPKGQRSEEENHASHQGFHWAGDGGHGGVQFSLGIGFFPVSFIASFFNPYQENAEIPEAGSRQQQEEQMLSNTLLFVGFLFVLWLIFY